MNLQTNCSAAHATREPVSFNPMTDDTPKAEEPMKPPFPVLDNYDPVESLRKEVKRFQATNQFNALLVTNFYAQAAVVLYQYDELLKERDRLANEMRALVTEVQELRARECPGCQKIMDRYCPQCQKDWES